MKTPEQIANDRVLALDEISTMQIETLFMLFESLIAMAESQLERGGPPKQVFAGIRGSLAVVRKRLS